MRGNEQSREWLIPWLVRRIHRDEEGGVSIETVLILAAVSLPVLIFLAKYVWPRILKYFKQKEDELFEEGVEDPAAAGDA